MMKQVLVTLPPVPLPVAFQNSQSIFFLEEGALSYKYETASNDLSNNHTTNCNVTVKKGLLCSYQDLSPREWQPSLQQQQLVSRWMSRQQEEQKQGQWAISFLARQGLGDFSLDIYCCAVTYHSPGECKDFILGLQSRLSSTYQSSWPCYFPAVLNFRLMLYCM